MNADSHGTWRRLPIAAVLAVLVAIAAWTMPSTARVGVSQTAHTPTATATHNPHDSPPPVLGPSDDPDIEHSDVFGGDGASNIVRVTNRQDNRMRIRGAIQLNRIPGPRVTPVNDAEAFSSCTDCQTIAVALQIDLVSRNASFVAPQNIAIALNFRCTRCTTIARALQFVIPVDDPREVPDDVMDLIESLDRELHAVAHDPNATLASAEARIDGVIARFNELAQFLFDRRDLKSD